jgi:hypothetical protein
MVEFQELAVSELRTNDEWLKPGAWGCKTKGYSEQSAEVFALPS